MFVKEIWARAGALQNPRARRARRTVPETDFKTSFPWVFGLPRELTKPKPETLKALPRVTTDHRLQTRFSKNSLSRTVTQPFRVLLHVRLQSPGRWAEPTCASHKKKPEPERRQVNVTVTSKPPWSKEYGTSSAR